jgi:hypothetical protein
MQSYPRLLLVLSCAILSAVATAQSAERNSSAPTVSAHASAPSAPAVTLRSSGSPKAVLVPFGPFVTQVGVGASGANVSELYTTFTLGSVGYNIFGYGMQSSANISVADDFTVPGAASWTVNTIRWISYQTGAPTNGTITALSLNLWNTPPATQVPGNQWVTGSNQLQSLTWTGAYRVTDTTLTANSRALIQVNCNGGWIPPLGPGSYWLEAQGGGSLSSGPWAPVKTVAGQAPPTIAPWNGVQSVSLGAFAQTFDTGNPLGSIFEASDYLWSIEGTSSGGVASFCTSKISSLGCAPLLSTSSATADKSGSPSTLVTAAPVPGGSGLPGILIYSKNPPVAPIATSFGFLCLSAFARAGSFPSTPGGTSGSCSGMYVWDLASIAAGTPGILIGDVLRIQAWYRDSGFAPPGNANFTHGLNAVTVVTGGGPSPSGSSIVPTSGGAGTSVVVTGSNFGTNPGDLKLLLANGEGFADVVSAAGNSLMARVFPVGNTGTGAVTVILGNGVALPNQSFPGAPTSNSSNVRALTNGVGTNFGSFTLSPSTANTISAKSGTPIAGGLSLDMTPIAGTAMVYRLSIKFLTGEFNVYQGRIDFGGVPSPTQRAAHFADHLNASFGTLGVSASSSGSSVRISTAGAAYTGIVVAGV